MSNWKKVNEKQLFFIGSVQINNSLFYWETNCFQFARIIKTINLNESTNTTKHTIVFGGLSAITYHFSTSISNLSFFCKFLSYTKSRIQKHIPLFRFHMYLLHFLKFKNKLLFFNILTVSKWCKRKFKLFWTFFLITA